MAPQIPRHKTIMVLMADRVSFGRLGDGDGFGAYAQFDSSRIEPFVGIVMTVSIIARLAVGPWLAAETSNSGSPSPESDGAAKRGGPSLSFVPGRTGDASIKDRRVPRRLVGALAFQHRGGVMPVLSFRTDLLPGQARPAQVQPSGRERLL